ncbi:MAG: formate dehydrogenase accessory protein FdhE [Candidatus Alcyoniella australis]|nr:formate dehydrogenase accessory protein FdhE [Candidatus Alcyoniella australis]
MKEDNGLTADSIDKQILEPGAHCFDPSGMQQACEAHRGTAYASDDLLDTLVAIEQLYEQLGDPVKGGEAFELPLEQARLRLDEGFHLLDPRKVEWDEKLLGEHMLRLAKFFAKRDPDRAHMLTALTERLENGTEPVLPWLYEQTPLDHTALERRAAELYLPEEMVMFLGDHLARPALLACARRLADLVDLKVWLRGTCPICGNAPGLGALNPEEGALVLRCSHCRFVWNFQRILCPACDNEDHKKLKYLTAENDSPHRIHACDECRSYVKVLDYRKARQDVLWFPEVEDAATIYLDLLARQEGYERL